MVLLILFAATTTIIGGAMVAAAMDVKREMKEEQLMVRKNNLKAKRLSARVRRCVEADLIINSIKEYEN